MKNSADIQVQILVQCVTLEIMHSFVIKNGRGAAVEEGESWGGIGGRGSRHFFIHPFGT